ncbi:hypothetical protein ACLBXX_09485 [Microbacterium sp. C23T]
MAMDEIWARLAPVTRDWLIANNGDAVPADIAAEIDEVADSASADDVWAVDPEPGADDALDLDDDESGDPDSEDGPGVRYLADDVVDWIEEQANNE